MNLPDLVIAGGCLSDLFFNYEHPEYDKLYAKDEDIGQEEIEKAVRRDADEFCLTIGQRNNQELAAALTANFLQRM